jgi:phenylpropionate dioxygenase-like ring-hydroxylating dioxygenase large terminal subunit
MKTAKPAFPLNAWYAAAYDVEVGRTLLARTLCNQKLVMFRKTDGSVAVLEDACWHRLLPLSMGRLDGDEVTCGYHGLVYNAQGRCTHMPSQETLNPSACVRSYPVVERTALSGCGPATRPRPTRRWCPTCTGTTTRPGPGDGKLITVKCDYRLVIDNLMDLTHETFVHGSSIGQRPWPRRRLWPRMATAPPP